MVQPNDQTGSAFARSTRHVPNSGYCTTRTTNPSVLRTFVRAPSVAVQPFSQKPCTPTVAKEFQIGLYDPAEAGLESFAQVGVRDFPGL